MASQVRIKFNSDGFKAILCGDGVHGLVSDAAQRIQAEANGNNTRGGDGFSCNTYMGGFGGGRWIASVTTTDRESKIAEAEDKALSRAVHP